jgi:hypothetical protein
MAHHSQGMESKYTSTLHANFKNRTGRRPHCQHRSLPRCSSSYRGRGHYADFLQSQKRQLGWEGGGGGSVRRCGHPWRPHSRPRHTTSWLSTPATKYEQDYNRPRKSKPIEPPPAMPNIHNLRDLQISANTVHAQTTVPWHSSRIVVLLEHHHQPVPGILGPHPVGKAIVHLLVPGHGSQRVIVLVLIHFMPSLSTRADVRDPVQPDLRCRPPLYCRLPVDSEHHGAEQNTRTLL